jgi:PTH1 family peptidyl-tRNA hydrolase
VVRLKQGGSHAGHNGIRDVIAHVGEQVWRIRIGIGRPGVKGEGVDYVLTRPPADEERLIDEAIHAAVDVIPVFLEEGSQKAMSLLHSREPPRVSEA